MIWYFDIVEVVSDIPHYSTKKRPLVTSRQAAAMDQVLMSVKLADLLDLEDGEGVEVVGILRAFKKTGTSPGLFHTWFFLDKKTKAAATSVWTLSWIPICLRVSGFGENENNIMKTFGKEFVRFCWWCGWAPTIQTTPTNNQTTGSLIYKKIAASLHSIQRINNPTNKEKKSQQSKQLPHHNRIFFAWKAFAPSSGRRSVEKEPSHRRVRRVSHNFWF